MVNSLRCIYFIYELVFHHTGCWEALNSWRKGIKAFRTEMGADRLAQEMPHQALGTPVMLDANSHVSVYSPFFLGKGVHLGMLG